MVRLVVSTLSIVAVWALPVVAQEDECRQVESGSITVVAEDNRFDTECISAPAGEPFTLTLDNQDRFAHNLSVYQRAGGEAFFVGDYVPGHETADYSVDPIQEGTWYFRCDIHPTMEGTFVSGESGEGASVDVPERRAPLGEKVRLERVAAGITAPVFMTAPADGSGRLFVVDQIGLIRVVEDGSLREEPFLDLRERIVELNQEYDERGLLGLAFHPDYAQNGRFFVYYSAPLASRAPDNYNHTARLSEFRVSDDADRADPESERIIFAVDQPQPNHNGGHIAFGPDGYLYIPLGDGGNANDVGVGHVPQGNGQTLSTPLGKVLRIDIDAEGGDFAIPQDNPFVDDDEARPEIFALGFRNPYHLSFDAGGERALFVADAGQDRFEEISIVEAGGNYGWRIKEGTHCFDPQSPSHPPEDCPDEGANGRPLVDPVIEYSHEEIASSVVVGGYVYRGPAMPELEGDYVFGDYSRDRVQPDGILFAASPSGGGLWPLRELRVEIAGAEDGGEELERFVLGFGEDEQRELYVGVIERGGPTGMTGAVYRFAGVTEAAPEGGEGAAAAEEDGGFPTWVWIAALVLMLLAAALVVGRTSRREH